MKKKGIAFFAVIALVFSLCAWMIGCVDEQESVYKSIALEGPVEIMAGEFDVSEYTVVLTKQDGTTENAW